MYDICIEGKLTYYFESRYVVDNKNWFSFYCTHYFSKMFEKDRNGKKNTETGQKKKMRKLLSRTGFISVYVQFFKF